MCLLDFIKNHIAVIGSIGPVFYASFRLHMKFNIVIFLSLSNRTTLFYNFHSKMKSFINKYCIYIYSAIAVIQAINEYINNVTQSSVIFI